MIFQFIDYLHNTSNVPTADVKGRGQHRMEKWSRTKIATLDQLKYDLLKTFQTYDMK